METVESRPRRPRGVAIYLPAARASTRGGHLENRIQRAAPMRRCDGQYRKLPSNQAYLRSKPGSDPRARRSRREETRDPIGVMPDRAIGLPDAMGRPAPRLTAAPTITGRRVRSWLRMNAGGAPNTCKSNGTHLRVEASGERLSNTWRTRPPPGDSLRKRRVTPDDPAARHLAAGKTPVEGDGSAAHQVDGGVTAHRADNG